MDVRSGSTKLQIEVGVALPLGALEEADMEEGDMAVDMVAVARVMVIAPSRIRILSRRR